MPQTRSVALTMGLLLGYKWILSGNAQRKLRSLNSVMRKIWQGRKSITITSQHHCITTSPHHLVTSSSPHHLIITTSPHPQITTSPHHSQIVSSRWCWWGWNHKPCGFSHKVLPGGDVGNLVCATGAACDRVCSDGLLCESWLWDKLQG